MKLYELKHPQIQTYNQITTLLFIQLPTTNNKTKNEQ